MRCPHCGKCPHCGEAQVTPYVQPQWAQPLTQPKWYPGYVTPQFTTPIYSYNC